MSQIAAVILAGGKAERLGGLNKALIEIGGLRLVDRAIAAAGACSPILLAVGRSAFEVAGTRAVPDLETDYAGPLAGVAAAVEALEGSGVDYLLSLAVDTPFFPPDFVARARPLLQSAPAVLSAFGAQDYPTNALWRLSAIADLPARLRAGSAPRSLKRLAEGLGAARLDYAAYDSDNPFANLNTPDDLAELRARARP
jgi:molybdopterin-guanine dinucleotide biosynthesis protein A